MEKPNKTIPISWLHYLQNIQKVFEAIQQDGYNPDFVAGIARGGLFFSTRLSYLLDDRPYILIAAENWPKGKKAKKIRFARHCIYVTKSVFGKILLCDDLTETGETFERGKEYLRNKFPKITEIRTACIFHKEWSKFTPDYFAEELKIDKDGEIPWILQPMENPEILL